MAFDIEAVKRKTIEKYPWFGGLVSGLEWEATSRVARTASDGRTVFYEPGSMAPLPPEEQLFYIAHELCHIAFDHISRSRGKDREVWNTATDAVINQLLRGDGLPIPEGCVDHPEAAGMSAEKYYEELLEYKLAIELVEGNINVPEGSREDGADRKREGGGSDEHSLWEAAAEEKEQEEKEREEELLRELERIKELAEEMQEDEASEEDGSSEGDDGSLKDPDAEPDEEEEMALFARKHSSAGDDVIDPDRRYVDEISGRKALIDWRMILRETIRQGVDWTFTNAVIEDGLVRPALEEIPTPETEIVVDTSWSVDEELLRSFLEECKNILRYSKLKIGCFDTRFYGFQEIRTPGDIDDLVLEGGGGTDLEAATGAFTLRVDNRIIFTDGEAPIPQEPMDAVWMIYGDEKIDPPGGKVIHIRPELLK